MEPAARSAPTRLGHVVVAARVDGGHGLPARTTRRFPTWGLTFVTAGTGRYLDATHDEAVTAGTLVLVFPGHPHWYGPAPGTWDENFVVFHGPVFDLALRGGALRPGSPLVHGLPVARWRARFDAFRTRPASRTAAERDAEALELLGLLVEAFGGTSPPSGPDWFTTSRTLLEADPAEALSLEEVAEAVAVPYETWRRRFREEAGTSPHRYRAEHRLRTATDLLAHTGLSTRDVAAATGFSDERHLVRRFRERNGLTPKQFRDRCR